MIATAVIGASNALRERAWDPQSMWGWADPLVEQATKAVYEKVFSVFGVDHARASSASTCSGGPARPT